MAGPRKYAALGVTEPRKEDEIPFRRGGGPAPQAPISLKVDSHHVLAIDDKGPFSQLLVRDRIDG